MPITQDRLAAMTFAANKANESLKASKDFITTIYSEYNCGDLSPDEALSRILSSLSDFQLPPETQVEIGLEMEKLRRNYSRNVREKDRMARLRAERTNL